MIDLIVIIVVNKFITLVLLLSRLSHLNRSHMAEPFRKSLIEIHSEIFFRMILFQDSPTFELRRFSLLKSKKLILKFWMSP